MDGIKTDKKRRQLPPEVDHKTIIQLVEKHPNDMELGKEIRKYVNSLKTKCSL